MSNQKPGCGLSNQRIIVQNKKLIHKSHLTPKKEPATGGLFPAASSGNSPETPSHLLQ
jgi:hypothetical protein